MIVRLVALYLAVFTAVLAALSIGAYLFVGTQYHSLLLPALSTPEGVAAYRQAMQRVALTIVAFDIPLVILVGIASWLLARISVAPWVFAREREREFIADAAHELRSPLATISSVAQAARKGDDASMREALELIAKTSLDASGVITDLLTLARLPSSTLLVREPVDLAAIVFDCVAEFRTRAGAAGIAIESNVASAIINGDARRLRELTRNLLENALHHARSTITVSCSSNAGRAQLSVSDDGAGVPPQSRDRIFERFFRNGAASGTGLGLAIARWVAQAHEGSIALSDRTPGASFIVEIPLISS
ncbi:MAG: HAMP domain-containing histidine kinase [Candidatus Eremiobacteraeota bacterium]|nr:HAMP domain-containing histidine kinase [Candidatus Eremiobacteraeota bacterium]